MTAKEDAAHRDEHLRDWHERWRSGRYTAPPVERVWLDQEEGFSRKPMLPGKPEDMLTWGR